MLPERVNGLMHFNAVKNQCRMVISTVVACIDCSHIIIICYDKGVGWL